MIDDLILAEQLIKKAAMPERYRGAVLGYYFEGKTYEEVGADLGCGKERARQIVQKAIMQIQVRFNISQPRFKWLKPIPKKPKEERISEAEYYRLLALEES